MKERDTHFTGDHYLDGMKRPVSISNKNIPADDEDAGEKEGSPGMISKHVCQVCGNIWDANLEKKDGPRRCPACSSVLWNNNYLKRHKCKQCSHIWMSKLDSPLVCPGCRSKLWNKDTERFECRTCGNLWKHKIDMGPPERCPGCRSNDIVPELVECICERCGYSGEMKSNQINRCPTCMSTLSIHKGAQGYDRRAKDRKCRSRTAPPGSIGYETLTILESDINDTMKIIELGSRAGMDNAEAEILVRFNNGEDPVIISRVTDTSLDRVIITTMHMHRRREGRHETY